MITAPIFFNYENQDKGGKSSFLPSVLKLSDQPHPTLSDMEFNLGSQTPRIFLN